MAGVAASTDTKQLNEKLVKAVKNSRRKGYHGQECDSQMPEPSDQTDARAKNLIEQIADMKIEKEELNDIALETNSASDADDHQKKFKQHIKSIKLNGTYSKASNDQWKQLCIKNFDFI